MLETDDLLNKARPQNSTADLSKMKDRELVKVVTDELQRRGKRVLIEKQTGEGEVSVPEVQDTDRIKFAVASDWHLCSRFQQLTHLRSFYKYAKKQRCKFVLMPGDMVEGSHKMHRDATFYQFVHGADAQIDYAIQHAPTDLKTYCINGNHDYSHFNDAGVNVVKRVAENVDSIQWIGDLGATVHLGPVNAYLWHPMGGGGYARSYKLQNWVRDRPINHRPHLLFSGHVHTLCHIPQYTGVEAFQVGCFQAQTPFINRLALTPDVGGLILDIGLKDDGSIQRVKTEWIHFSDWIRDDYK